MGCRDGVESDPLQILSGVRQGGVLSPLLCKMYEDYITNKLENSGLGCHYVDCYIACIMYADDLFLNSSLDLCSTEGSYLSINFNYRKSNCIVIEPRRFANLSTLYLSGIPLSWVEKMKYLGLYIITFRIVQGQM